MLLFGEETTDHADAVLLGVRAFGLELLLRASELHVTGSPVRAHLCPGVPVSWLARATSPAVEGVGAAWEKMICVLAARSAAGSSDVIFDFGGTMADGGGSEAALAGSCTGVMSTTLKGISKEDITREVL